MMFDKLINWVKDMMKMFSRNDLSRAIDVNIAVSSEMGEALGLWSQMYENKAPWLNETIKSLNLPAAIAAEVARLVTMEMKTEISGSTRADWLNTQYQGIMQNVRRYVEYGCAKGGLILKPYIDGKRIAIDYIQADCFFPTAFDSSGRITGVIFTDRIMRNNKIYTRLEYHNMQAKGCYVSNLAFVSTNKNELGRQIDLVNVDEWSTLEPEVLIRNINRPLFAYFKIPLANTIDTQSPLGVSIYSRAVDLICEADKQYSRLLWEFESGERALYVSDMAFKKDEKGNIKFPNKRLYRALAEGEDLFEEWTPTLREQNILNALDSILTKIEDSCGLARGTFTNPQNEAKTATELKILRQRSYATVADTQKALQSTLEDLVYAMDVWATLGHLAPAGKYDVTFEWDDSIVSDRQAEYAERSQLVSLGVMQPWELRSWYLGESEETAKQMITE